MFMIQQNTMLAGEGRAMAVRFHPYATELVVADAWSSCTYVMSCPHPHRSCVTLVPAS